MIKETKHIDFFTSDQDSTILIPLIEDGLQAGFPSPAADYIDLKLDLNKELVKNPNATFYGRVKGNSMVDAGISDGDVLVIDKSLDPSHGTIAVCFIDGEFTVKRIIIKKKELYLEPANDQFKTIKVTEDNAFIVWGVVTYVIKNMGAK